MLNFIKCLFWVCIKQLIWISLFVVLIPAPWLPFHQCSSLCSLKKKKQLPVPPRPWWLSFLNSLFKILDTPPSSKVYFLHLTLIFFSGALNTAWGVILDTFLSDNSNQPPKAFARMKQIDLCHSGDSAWHTVSALERSARIMTIVVATLTSFGFPDTFLPWSSSYFYTLFSFVD